VKKRWFAGVEFAVNGYNAGKPGDSLANSRGFFRTGIMEDKLWENVQLSPASEDGMTPATFSDESERYFLEGELEIPKVGTDSWRLLLRTFASIPTSGKGPSDVRVSALVSIDPRQWFPNLGSGGQ